MLFLETTDIYEIKNEMKNNKKKYEIKRGEE